MTLIDTLGVVAILLILAAIGFHLGGPMRETGRQSVCISQLRQLHMATLQYGMDSMTGEEVPGLEGFSLQVASNPYLLIPYVGKLEAVAWCPDYPLRPHPHLVPFTYQSRVRDWRHVNVNEPREVKEYEENRELILKSGSAFPYRVCRTHDQVYYFPREVGALAEGFPNPMFVLESRWDGSVVRTRSTLHGIRHGFISPLPKEN